MEVRERLPLFEHPEACRCARPVEDVRRSLQSNRRGWYPAHHGRTDGGEHRTHRRTTKLAVSADRRFDDLEFMADRGGIWDSVLHVRRSVCALALGVPRCTASVGEGVQRATGRRCTGRALAGSLNSDEAARTNCGVRNWGTLNSVALQHETNQPGPLIKMIQGEASGSIKVSDRRSK